MPAKEMNVKKTNGEIVRFNVDDVAEVYFVKTVEPIDSSIVDASDLMLKFNILSDSSSVEVTKDFAYCDIETIVIPDKVRIDGNVYEVTSIGSWAFAGFSSLTSIEIPSSVTYIGESAFNECENLNVVIDNSKENIKVGNDAFLGCKSVKYSK